jgi:hypothetical protein
MKTTRLSIGSMLLGASLAGIGSGCDAQSPSGPPDRAASRLLEAEGPSQEAPSGAVAISAALREPDAWTRVGSLAELLSTLGPEAVPDVHEMLDRFRFDVGAAEYELLVRYWASHDPSAATKWALQVRASRHRILALNVAAELWAREDPAAALSGLAIAAQSFEQEVAQTVQLALVRGWFQTDRPGLERYIQDLGMGIERQRALRGYAIALRQAEGSDAVMRWAEAIPDEDERYRASVVRQVGSALAWSDPEAAEIWCDRHCDGRYGRGMRGALVRARLFHGEYGGSVVEWVARAPEGRERKLALTTAFETWAMRDREEALGWMEQKLTSGSEPWVRELYLPYARQLAAISPAEAIEWAERVEADAGREEILVRVARRWLREDEEAALAWLARSPLSEEARARARDMSLPDYIPEASTP